MSKKSTKRASTNTYTYYFYDKESRREIPITITAGKDGVTEAHIALLREFDHEEQLQNRYEKENRSYVSENAKSKYFYDPENVIGDPIEQLPDTHINPFDIEAANSNFENDSDIQILNTLLPQLSEMEQFLFEEIYYNLNKNVDIASKLNVTEGTIRYRHKQLLKKLKRFLEK